jgi:hypothetical protein
VVQDKLNDTTDPVKTRRSGRWKLFAVLAVCAAPLIASYLAYYVIKPEGRTNYGALIDPRTHPIPALASTTLDGKPRTLEQLSGKWIMLKVGGGECLQACQDQLLAMRQWRLMQGKNMERIERVWLVTDDQPLDTMTIRQYDGMEMLRAPGGEVAKWLPAEAGGSAADHVYLIDPRGNLMMRFPKQPEAKPADLRASWQRRVYQDIAKLLKASAIG